MPILEPGCRPDRPAVAHRADGRALDPQPAGGYVTCAVPTGTRGGACPIAVATARGSILYSPAVRNAMMDCDLVRSRDRGASWQTIVTPRDPQYPPEGYRAPRIRGMRPRDFRQLAEELAPGCTLHPWLCVDRTTGRIFASAMVKGATADGSGSVVAFSDDDGETWKSSAVGAGSWDWGKVFSGPPATEASRKALTASGYPNLVYFSATGPTLISGPNQINYKSTDGGATWTRTANTFSETQEKAFATGFPQRGVVDARGAIYRPWAGTPLEYMPGSDKSNIPVHIVRSLDEGESWQHFTLADTHTSLLGATIAIDAEDTLYVVWADSRDGLIRFSISRDQAATWSAPRVIQIPGVAWVAKPTVEVRGPGELALAFWGSTQVAAQGDGWFSKDGRPYSGYLTVTGDIHAAEPLFWTCAINDVADPLLADGESALSSGEYIGPPSFADDGSIWGGFVRLGANATGIAARLLPSSNSGR